MSVVRYVDPKGVVHDAYVRSLGVGVPRYNTALCEVTHAGYLVFPQWESDDLEEAPAGAFTTCLTCIRRSFDS